MLKAGAGSPKKPSVMNPRTGAVAAERAGWGTRVDRVSGAAPGWAASRTARRALWSAMAAPTEEGANARSAPALL